MATRTNGKHQSREDSIKELKRDFEQRIHDIQAEAGEAGEGVSSAVDDSLNYLKTEIEQGLSDLHKQVDESVEPGRQAIREKPFTSAGAAIPAGLIAGVLLGVYLTRKSK